MHPPKSGGNNEILRCWVWYRAGGDLLRLILAQRAAERRALEEHAGTEGAGPEDGLPDGIPYPLPRIESTTDDGVRSHSSHGKDPETHVLYSIDSSNQRL